MGLEAMVLGTGAALGGAILGADAAGDAAQMQADSNWRAIQEQQRQYDLNRQDLSPFLNAATGRNGALNQLMSGINQPQKIPNLPGAYTNVPQLQQFSGAPQLQQFGGQAVSAPGLEQFSFDPSKALDSPAMQFQMEMGQQQLDRVAGKNRLLGSGQRLIEAQKFGQGLASQSLGEEFQRQLTQNQQRNNTAGQQFSMAGQSLGQGMDINNMNNQIRQQGFGNQSNVNQMNNQVAQSQYGMNAGANDAQTNRLLQQYGLTNDSYNQRLNRLAGIVDVGRGTGTAMAQMGGQTAGNIANLMQNTGQAQANGRIGEANAYSNLLQQGAMMYGMSGGFGGSSMNANYSGGIPVGQWMGMR